MRDGRVDMRARKIAQLATPDEEDRPKRAGRQEGGVGFTGLPLCLICCVLGVVLLGYCWQHGVGAYFVLRSGLWRAPVRDSEPRQLLIVGTQSAGTTATSEGLQALGLEIEHENSNSGETECRDGTVSWFHGVRFFPGEVAPGTIDGLCLGKFRRVGWHPHMFRNPRGCWGEWWGLWGACWEQTCREVAAEIWGCARRTDRPCETPFVRSLLQVRHPLRVVESLGVKFCESADAAVNPDISHIFAAMWPANADKFSSSESGCLRAIAWYWTLYHESLEGALESGALHGWYRVEGSTACGIARLAGFDRPETAIFQPSVAQYHERCVSNPLPKKQRPSVNQRNRGKLHVQPSQIDELDSELGQRMRTLALRFGYLYEDDPAEGAAEESDAAKPPKRAGRKLVRQRVGDGDNDWKGARDSVHRN